VLGIAVIAGATIWRSFASRPQDAERPQHSIPAAASPPPAYVGTDTCAKCHRDSFDAWQKSQHKAAMQPASATSVAGRFDGSGFRYDDVVSTFFQRDGRYWVRTDGPDGKLADFEVKYTFGVDPLQQYLIELPGGRVQALSIAWDTRPKTAGGQRWFHLYPREHIRHDDELHWTRRQQNWNFMCADCHSTNLRKNYDPASDTFRTTWSEMNVGCEACHGPGSRHVEWGQRAQQSGAAAPDNGLTVHLTERRNVAWRIDGATLKPVRSVPRTTSAEIDTCAPCHSRRTQISDGYYPGAPLLDFYEPATLEPSLYFHDGQQREEVYTHGSFLQSRMAHAGVTCSDCHEAHTGTLRAPGNALCTRCHAAPRYDAPAHHRHRAGSAAAACVECHMPARTYMQIDARRDHSLRVPRPDLTAATGAPNACNSCHADRTPAWAAATIKQWLGRDALSFQTFATAFHDADQQQAAALSSLRTVAASSDEPPIVRATAVERLATLGAPVSSFTSALGDASPLVRRSGLRALEGAPAAESMPFVQRLLSDPVRAVRMAAGRLLSASATQLVGADRDAFNRAAAEIEAAARYNGDRPESRLSLGVFLAEQGRTSEAANEYRAALRLGPDFPPGYINLAELLRTTGPETAAEEVLRAGIARNPRSAELHYALGLSLTRARRAQEAIAELQKANALAPEHPRFTYAYALALNGSAQSAAAIRVLESGLARHPHDRDILFALATFARDAGQLVAARGYARRLVQSHPADPEARALLESLERARPQPPNGGPLPPAR
jgi:predicted CXXCH cytochrome family protein